MNRNSKSILVAICVVLLPLSVSAQKNTIYSWTDENGVQHFSDREPDETAADVQVIPVTAPVEPVDGAAEVNTETTPDTPADSGTDGTAEELSFADQQRQAMEEKRQAQREKQSERQRICLQAKDQLARIEPSRRVFYTDESGETARLDDEERVRMVEESRKLVEEYCD